MAVVDNACAAAVKRGVNAYRRLPAPALRQTQYATNAAAFAGMPSLALAGTKRKLLLLDGGDSSDVLSLGLDVGSRRARISVCSTGRLRQLGFVVK